MLSVISVQLGPSSKPSLLASASVTLSDGSATLVIHGFAIATDERGKTYVASPLTITKTPHGRVTQHTVEFAAPLWSAIASRILNEWRVRQPKPLTPNFMDAADSEEGGK
jgi:hypothetical protein